MTAEQEDRHTDNEVCLIAFMSKNMPCYEAKQAGKESIRTEEQTKVFEHEHALYTREKIVFRRRKRG